jgi:hypothetical protein
VKLPSLLHTALLGAVLCGTSSFITAQVSCYESNFGTALGTGDDTVFPFQPLGFAFPFGGQTYTDVSISTNGLMYLSNGGVPTAGGSGCCAGSSTTLLANGPTIAPWWMDLNVTSTYSGQCYINQLSSPSRAVITWHNVIEYSHTQPYDIQCQLYATGEIVMFYSTGTTVQTHTCLVGFSPGGGVADPGASDLSTNPSTTSTSVYEMFNGTTLPFDIGGRSIIFTPNVAGGYDVDANTCSAPSGLTSYGSGCYSSTASFYENIATAAAFDLGNTSVLLTPNANGGYDVTPGSNNYFTPVSADLGLGDDGLSAGLALPFTLNFPGGNTGFIQICANGYVLLQNGTSGFGDWSPTSGELLSQGPRICPAWHDWASGAAGAGAVEFDVDPSNTAAYVTYDGIGEFSAASASTFQVAFFSNGQIEFRYQSIAPINNTFITGFSSGGGAADPGSIDISTSMPFSTAPFTLALGTSVSANPVAGSVVNLTTNNIPASSLLTGQVLSFGQVNPGTDLGTIGAPGCLQLIDLSLSSTIVLVGSPSVSTALTIPTAVSWLGAVVYTQSVSLVPGVNAAGALTSNGVAMTIGAF